jgi:hypothetical protein
MTLEAQRLRRLMGADTARPPFARVLAAAAIGVLAVGTGPALAQGAGPEKPPVKAPVKLNPEPAPVARSAPAPSVSTQPPASSTSQATPATPSRPAVVVTSTKPVQDPSRTAAIPTPKAKAPPAAPAKPRATKAVKSFADSLQSSATRIAVSAPPAGSSESNRLLFLGGLALLVLVLGDAAFLAFSARVLREPERY